MDFTREPIIETVITPREGYRLVVRSSKSAGQEEHFVDALEIVSFGQALFFRSLERPKPFVVPVSDYEVLEVREPRMVLKAASCESPVKIGLRSDVTSKASREQERKEALASQALKVEQKEEDASQGPSKSGPASQEGRTDRRRDRRRPFRRRRGGKDELQETTGTEDVGVKQFDVEESLEPPDLTKVQQLEEMPGGQKQAPGSPLLASVLPPPTTLIRDDIARLRASDLYRGAFYLREEGEASGDDDTDQEEDPFVQRSFFEQSSSDVSDIENPGYSMQENIAKEVTPQGDPFCSEDTFESLDEPKPSSNEEEAEKTVEDPVRNIE